MQATPMYIVYVCSPWFNMPFILANIYKNDATICPLPDINNHIH